MKKVLLWSIPLISIGTICISISCKNNEVDNNVGSSDSGSITPNPIKKNETKIKSTIEASELGLSNQEAKNALNLIDQKFIFKNKTIFLTGDNNLFSASEIIPIDKKDQNNQITLTFSLAAKTWYDQNGNLGTNNKQFNTTIIGFKSNTTNPIKKNETKIKSTIKASELNLSNQEAKNAVNLIDQKFIFNNKTVFLTGDNNLSSYSAITINKKEVQNNQITLTFSLAAKTWYDQNGNLGTNIKQFNTTITEFKSVNPNPEPDKPITPPIIEPDKPGVSNPNKVEYQYKNDQELINFVNIEYKNNLKAEIIELAKKDVTPILPALGINNINECDIIIPETVALENVIFETKNNVSRLTGFKNLEIKIVSKKNGQSLSIQTTFSNNKWEIYFIKK